MLQCRDKQLCKANEGGKANEGDKRLGYQIIQDYVIVC